MYKTGHDGDVVFGPGNRIEIVRCGCQKDLDNSRRRAYLLTIDGLTAAERDLRFATLKESSPSISGAIRDVYSAVRERKGLITLHGKPGVGKSTLLIAAVNEARTLNVQAVYTTVTDLLDYLRSAFNPSNGEMGFDGRWQLLTTVEVLALDELDEMNTTPWAMERFLRLIDERWRNMGDHLTLCATNRLGVLPDKVVSRLRDQRGRVLQLDGPDMRRYQSWTQEPDV